MNNGWARRGFLIRTIFLCRELVDSADGTRVRRDRPRDGPDHGMHVTLRRAFLTWPARHRRRGIAPGIADIGRDIGDLLIREFAA